MTIGATLFESVKLGEKQLDKVKAIQSVAAELFQIIEASTPPTRERDEAVKNLEQAVMWATKNISRNQ